MTTSTTTTTARRAAGAALCALALPASAAAHVTINPSTVAAGSELELLVRVPSESDKAATTKVSVKLPPGFITVSYAPEPGWKVTVKTSKLAKPMTTDDGVVTEQVDEITWTGSGTGDGQIGDGQFKDFPISVAVPGKPGDTLTFKALQTYSDGSVVRWIGAPDSEEPAPTVKLTAAADEAMAGMPMPSSAPAPAVASATGASKGLGIAALVVGIVGVLLGGGALLRGRRPAA